MMCSLDWRWNENHKQKRREKQMSNESRAVIKTGASGIVLTDIESMYRWGRAVTSSGLAPKSFDTPEKVVVATQLGLELGLSPMTALQSIAVINGRPTVWGDVALGLCHATGQVEEFSEWYEDDKGERLSRNPVAFTDGITAVCKVKRRGQEAQESSFSVADAKRAKLWGKQGPWSEYPARMLKARARGFAIRDAFPDALKGLYVAEEVRDMPAEVDVTPKAAGVEVKKAKLEPRKKEAQAELPVDDNEQPDIETLANRDGITWGEVQEAGVRLNLGGEDWKGWGDIDEAATTKMVKVWPKLVEEIKKEREE
jgi:hypothetical protein